jgi:hypothetical protein
MTVADLAGLVFMYPTQRVRYEAENGEIIRFVYYDGPYLPNDSPFMKRKVINIKWTASVLTVVLESEEG